MEQYISKSALVAELEKRIKVSQDYAKCNLTENTRIGNHAQQIELNDILSFLDTFEVKEVDLEKEIQQHINDCLNIKFPTTDIKMIAKDVEYTARKFFELGLKAQKGK